MPHSDENINMLAWKYNSLSCHSTPYRHGLLSHYNSNSRCVLFLTYIKMALSYSIIVQTISICFLGIRKVYLHPMNIQYSVMIIWKFVLQSSPGLPSLPQVISSKSRLSEVSLYPESKVNTQHNLSITRSTPLALKPDWAQLALRNKWHQFTLGHPLRGDWLFTLAGHADFIFTPWTSLGN